MAGEVAGDRECKAARLVAVMEAEEQGEEEVGVVAAVVVDVAGIEPAAVEVEGRIVVRRDSSRRSRVRCL